MKGKNINIKPMTMWEYEQNDNSFRTEYRSSDLTKIGAVKQTKYTKVQGVDVTITMHIAKGSRFYTITFGGKAIDRLGIQSNSVISFSEHAERPDAIYITAEPHSGKRHTGEFKVRNLANGTYQVVMSSNTFIEFFDDYMEGDEVRKFPMFEDKQMDERGHYMIRQHILWDEDKAKR